MGLILMNNLDNSAKRVLTCIVVERCGGCAGFGLETSLDKLPEEVKYLMKCVSHRVRG